MCTHTECEKHYDRKSKQRSEATLILKIIEAQMKKNVTAEKKWKSMLAAVRAEQKRDCLQLSNEERADLTALRDEHVSRFFALKRREDNSFPKVALQWVGW